VFSVTDGRTAAAAGRPSAEAPAPGIAASAAAQQTEAGTPASSAADGSRSGEIMAECPGASGSPAVAYSREENQTFLCVCTDICSTW